MQAAANKDDTLHYARYQWSKMLYGEVNARDPETTVKQTARCLMTESRNVYDKLNRPGDQMGPFGSTACE